MTLPPMANGALRLPQVWQRELACGEVGDEVEVEEVPAVLDREVVDQCRRRVPARVVDQAVQPLEPPHRRLRGRRGAVRPGRQEGEIHRADPKFAT